MHRGMDSIWPLNMSCGIWNQTISSRSFKSCKLRGGASMDQICWSCTSHRCSIGLRAGKFGGQGNTLNSLSCSSHCPWTIFTVWQGTLSCWKRPLSSENTIAIKGCTFNSRQGSSWALWPVYGYLALKTANCDAQCLLTPLYHGIKFFNKLSYNTVAPLCVWTRCASLHSPPASMSLWHSWLWRCSLVVLPWAIHRHFGGQVLKWKKGTPIIIIVFIKYSCILLNMFEHRNMKHWEKIEKLYYYIALQRQTTLTRYSVKLRKMTLKYFICPAKLIIGRTLEIGQLDVLVMKIIYIKNCGLKLDFYPYFEVTVLCFCIVCKKWEVTPRQKAVTSTLSIFGCWSPFTKSLQ